MMRGGPPEYQAFMMLILGALGVLALVIVIVVPIVHHFKRKRERKELHDKIEKAKAHILEDGVVEGPKGDYVPHIPYATTTSVGTPHDTAAPKRKAYKGMEWQ
jgi:hypothetical protein